MSGTFYTQSGQFSLAVKTGKFDVTALQADLANMVKFSSYLKTDSLSFSKALNGDIEASVDGIELGLLSASEGSSDVQLNTEQVGNIHLDVNEKAMNAPLFRSAKITFSKKGEETKAIIKDPILGALVISGDIHSFTNSKDVGIKINRLVLFGQLKGDLVLQNTPEKLLLSSENDMEIIIPEASL
ncbi:MAG: hypothetical protein AAF734_05600, partial [Bacteroidota bacterium]